MRLAIELLAFVAYLLSGLLWTLFVVDRAQGTYHLSEDVMILALILFWCPLLLLGTAATMRVSRDIKS